jgi:hypothetical protein
LATQAVLEGLDAAVLVRAGVVEEATVAGDAVVDAPFGFGQPPNPP